MKHLVDNNFNTNKLENAQTPVNVGDVANKGYVDANAGGIAAFDRLTLASGGFNVSVTGSIQGVTFDGTHYYVTTPTHLYKYNSSGTLVTSRSNATDGNTHKYLGDLVVHNGKLYVASANFSGPPPFSTYVVEFNASDLSYITEYLVSSDMRCDTVTFNDGHFWLPMYERVIRKFDEDWNFVAEYPMNIGEWAYDTSAYGFGFDGATWIGNYLILNPHEDIYPNCMYVLYFNGTHFMRAGQPARPQYTTQGIQYIPETNQIIAAERGPTSRVTILNLRTDPPSISEWKEVGRARLEATGNSMSVLSIPPMRYLRISALCIPTGGTINLAVRFNNDAGANYARMRSTDYMDGAASVSQTSIGTSSAADDLQFLTGEVINIQNFAKLADLSLAQTWNNLATLEPRHIGVVGKWGDTSAYINRIDVLNTLGTGNFAIGSEVIVYGKD